MRNTIDIPFAQTTRLPDWLARCAQNHPARLAISCNDIRWNFAELDRQASKLARQLATLGITEGCHVALLASNGLPFVVVVHALTRLGAVLVPLNTRLTIDELCWQLRDIRAQVLLHDVEHTPRATEINARLPELHFLQLSEQQHEGELNFCSLPQSDILLRDEIDLNAAQAIMYTSGTTGEPKGAIITYGMQWWNAVGSALNLGLREDDCWLACLPLFHIGGLSILMRSVIYGMSVVAQQKFDAAAVNHAIREERVTIISVVAVMLSRMLAAFDAENASGRYPSWLRCVLLGGGPAPQPLLEDCARRNIPVVQTYGLTEACSQAVTLSPSDALRKLGSAGRPLMPVQQRILYEGHAAPVNQPGEIQLRGPTITPGYFGRPGATTQAIQNGWLATGDIGYLDEEGFLYVLDRRSDLIISGGENVYPAEIEAILLSHPDIEEAGVCGQDDVRWGQVPIAFVRLRDGSTTSEEDLQVYLEERLAKYKLPARIYRVGPLPRNSSGKLLRRELPGLLRENL